MIQLPREEWKLLACQNGASPDCIIVVVVEWLYYSKRVVIDKRAGLGEFLFSLIFVGCIRALSGCTCECARCEAPRNR